MDALWTFANSPLGIACISGVVLFVLNKVYGKKPAWAKYEGDIIAAIKMAEKQIPDGSPNTAMQKLDSALKLVISIFEDVERRRPTANEIHELKEGINVIHDDLESRGTL